MNQIIIGFTTEGTTDVRLLESILLRTFESVAIECPQQIEVINPIIYVDKHVGCDFNDNVFKCSKAAFSKGVMAFCIHVDADSDDDETVIRNRVNPSFENVVNSGDVDLCKDLVAIVPIQMSESWMLADKQLLKDEIGTDKTDIQLGIHRFPESYANPKATIENAIRIARQDFVKRRRNDLRISELYQPIGQKIDLLKLEQLRSYMKFKESVRGVYRNLKYLQ